MGLAGPKNRTKIGADPRNTNWSNNTDRFGHRILTTLGWQPGRTLGDTSSLYHQSGHITAASAAGVKVVLKDDNLGIGCNKTRPDDECVGLDGLQSLLGRLNGKGDAELEKEAETRDKLRRDVIVGERYGMRFIRGETYVSSDIDTLLKKIKLEEEAKMKVEVKEEVTKGEKKSKSKSKKEAKVKKETEVKKEESESEPEMSMIPITPSDEGASASIKKEKKEKIKCEKSSLKSESVIPVSGDDPEPKPKKRKREDEESTEKPKEKKDRVSKKSKNGETHEQRKERRAREKKEKKSRKSEKKEKKRKSKSSSDSDSSGDESTPATSGTATPSGYSALVGRQAVRHRFIAAKRNAVMDAKALNEIFMIKA